MPNDERGLAPSCYVETAEGAVQLAETPNKGFAVLTRLPTGLLGFRQLIKVVTRGPVPLLRVHLSTGHEVLAARGHPFYRVGMEAIPAERLASMATGTRRMRARRIMDPRSAGSAGKGEPAA